jgi:hypothetical protein
MEYQEVRYLDVSICFWGKERPMQTVSNGKSTGFLVTFLKYVNMLF